MRPNMVAICGTFRYIFLILFVVAPFGKSQEESLVVSLNQGDIRGTTDTSSKGSTIYSFLGIPYAKPPIGKYRFKDPQKAEPWQGVRDGSKQPDNCAHFDLLKFLMDASHHASGVEDCLIVNVFTRKLSGEADLPVMVFIHGGAFVMGGADFYEPNELLNEHLVLVVLQYRVGGLGFISTEDGVIPGNLGLKDQTFALRWVNENIHKFYGDSKRITIFGESAGAASVHAHILSDYSNGLFSRAILQSGSLLNPWANMINPREIAMEIGEHFSCFTDRNIEGKKKSEQLLDCLLKQDANELQLVIGSNLKWTFLPPNTVPYVDGDYFAEDFEILLRKGITKEIDVIYGVNKDEGAFITNTLLVIDQQRNAIVEDFESIGPISLGLEDEKNGLEISQAVYDRMAGGVNIKLLNFNNLTKMIGDRHFSIGVDYSALFHAKENKKTDKKTFFYELHHRGQRSFSDLWGNPHPGRNWVSHADEICYLFPFELLGPANRNDLDSKIRDIFTNMWANFAASGDPTPNDSLGFKWQEFTPENPKHLKITPIPMMENDLRKSVRKFWESLPLQQNKLLFGEADKIVKDEF